MFYQNNQFNGDCGCDNGCQQAVPTYQQCNQVVQTCNVQDIPHYTNYHTHVYLNLTYINFKINGLTKPFIDFKGLVLVFTSSALN